MEVLTCGTQCYDWGKLAPESEVARLVNADQNMECSTVRYAELWVGVHPKLPAKVLSSGEPLREFLGANKRRYLGDEHVRYYAEEKLQRTAADTLASTSVPFLLKVLSIGKALSIQAHPDRALAEVLHARDPTNYPDPNHKPELIVAITPFEALCCFRPLREIIYFIDSCAPFRRLLGDEVVAMIRETLDVDDQYHHKGGAAPERVKQVLRACMERLYATPEATNHSLVEEMCGLVSSPTFAASLPAHTNPLMGKAFDVFVRTNKSFSKDIGLWMIFFLNYLQLSPGEALYLGAAEPHAYLSGNGVEIMANSDNVIRAGLTPKFKDVGTLLDMLTYDTNALANSKYAAPGQDEPIREYAPPHACCDDFSLLAVKIGGSGGQTSVTHKLPSVGLGICLDGQFTVTCDGVSHTLEKGATFVVPIGEITLSTTTEAAIFIGTTNVHHLKHANL